MHTTYDSAQPQENTVQYSTAQYLFRSCIKQSLMGRGPRVEAGQDDGQAPTIEPAQSRAGVRRVSARYTGTGEIAQLAPVAVALADEDISRT